MKKLVRVSILAAALLAGLLAVAASAQADPLVNGGFETGTLEGWSTATETGGGAWEIISGTSTANGPPGSVPLPYEGTYDAVASQHAPDATVLYQDVYLTPGDSHELSLELFYHSLAPLATPEPDTLSNGVSEPNQQVRVDVMKAGSAVYSLAPSDILVPVFATEAGDPEEIGWTHLTANLTPFAGQTVRIRVVDVSNQNVLFAGIDAASITNEAEPTKPASPVTIPPATSPIPTVTPQCIVPKLARRKLKAAKKALRAADCKLGLVAKKNDKVTVKTGKVVKQSPKPGTVEAAGSRVSVKLG